MKKILFGIFAHPDDEAFGPCGTLVSEVKSGTELHLITLTLGQNGTNPDNAPDLGAVRLAEWQAAGKLIGATSQHHLDYIDGKLCNQDYHAITEKLIQIITEIVAGRTDDYEIELLTLDLGGYTGHIDHIVAARTTSYVFYRLQRQGLPMRRIRYYCRSTSNTPTHNIDWLYMDAGRTPEEVGDSVDARQYREEIIGIMRCHQSQQDDCEATLARQGDNLGLDHFTVKT